MAKRVKGRRDGLWVGHDGKPRPWGDTWNRQGGRKSASEGGGARKGGKSPAAKKGGKSGSGGRGH